MTGVPGPVDPRREAVRRSARREAARRLHPDLGGDAESFTRALAEIDARFRIDARPVTREPVVVIVRRRARLARHVRGRWRALRAATPARLVPGVRRRYIAL